MRSGTRVGRSFYRQWHGRAMAADRIRYAKKDTNWGIIVTGIIVVAICVAAIFAGGK